MTTLKRLRNHFVDAAVNPDEPLNRAVSYSIALHIVLFIVFCVRAFLLPPHEIQLEHAIRVDIVGLPDKIAVPPPLEEQAPAKLADAPEKVETKKPELPKPAPPKPDKPKVNLDKTKRDQAAALRRLEAIEKLRHSLKPQEKSDAGAKVADHSKPAPVKGNEVAKGSSLRGIAKQDYQNYNEAVHEHVHKHWNLPQWIANANLSAIILVHLDAQGNVVRKTLVKSSGQPDFDDRAMRTIEDSTPLPKPPSAVVDVLAVEGMRIEMAPD